MESSSAVRKSESASGCESETPIHVLILEFMSQAQSAASNQLVARHFQLHELSMGVARDERDVLRALYILEGHKLVTPFPVGDFTSKTWHLTEEGLAAVKKLSFLPKTL